MVAVLHRGEREKVLRFCFEKDKELIDKWHIESGRGINACVERTAQDLKGVEFYVIRDKDNEIAGWFGVEENELGKNLTGFFLCPEHRNERTKKWFVRNVENIINENFVCILYKKNERAGKFLLKYGFEIMCDRDLKIDEEPIVVYKYTLNKI